MDNVVEKRRAAIINIVYFAILFAVVYFGFDLLFPLLVPFILAFIFATIFNKPIKAINKKIPVRRNLLSVIFVLGMLGIFAGVFFLIGMEIYEKLRGFFDYAGSLFRNVSGLFNEIKLLILDVTSFLPQAVREMLHENVSSFFDNIIENGFNNISIDTSGIDWSMVLSTGGAFLSGTVGQIPSLIIAFIVTIISTVFMTNDYERITSFFIRQLPEATANKLITGWRLGLSSLKKMIKAYCLIILITTCELTVGFYILKFIGVLQLPYVLIVSVLIAIIDIIPVLGTGTVLLPWAVYSFVTGKIGLGIGLLVLYAVILVVRQIIEPKFVAGQVGLPPIATIAAMYIGTKTLGVMGFFILPFIVILLKVLNEEGVITLFKNAVSDRIRNGSPAEVSGAADDAAATGENNENID